MTWKSVQVDLVLNECLQALAGTALAGFDVDVAIDGPARAVILDEILLRHLLTLLAVACVRAAPLSAALRISLAQTPPTGPSISWLGASTDSWIALTFAADGSRGTTVPAVEETARANEVGRAYWEDLARASSLARLLGGRLVARSPDAGFGPVALYLPPAQVAAPASPSSPVRILVMDDNAETRWAMGEILRRAGFDVREAASAADIRNIVEGEPGKVGLIVGDLLLPVPQGVTLLLEASSMLGGAPVLLVTGRRLGEEVREWLSKMGVRWLVKPFNRDQLLRQVRVILSQEP
jgi:CheY-like chemotaxis protein